MNRRAASPSSVSELSEAADCRPVQECWERIAHRGVILHPFPSLQLLLLNVSDSQSPPALDLISDPQDCVAYWLPILEYHRRYKFYHVSRGTVIFFPSPVLSSPALLCSKLCPQPLGCWKQRLPRVRFSSSLFVIHLDILAKLLHSGFCSIVPLRLSPGPSFNLQHLTSHFPMEDQQLHLGLLTVPLSLQSIIHVASLRYIDIFTQVCYFSASDLPAVSHSWENNGVHLCGGPKAPPLYSHSCHWPLTHPLWPPFSCIKILFLTVRMCPHCLFVSSPLTQSASSRGLTKCPFLITTEDNTLTLGNEKHF